MSHVLRSLRTPHMGQKLWLLAARHQFCQMTQHQPLNRALLCVAMLLAGLIEMSI